MPIEINHRISIPDEAIEERFLAATGPGGQNVNKVATAVQLRCDTLMIDLPEAARIKLATIAGRRMSRDGAIMISAGRYRTQEMNRQDARERLIAMIKESLTREAPRRPTRPTKASQRRRLEGKSVRSSVKRARSKPVFD